MNKQEDERWMAAALRFSRHHQGMTGENPCVAAFIVKNNILLGMGITGYGGRPHAETQALAQAGLQAEGATAYVTLEPCAHHGKTPPCVEALIKARIARVVIAILDPDRRVFGRGVQKLQEANIDVTMDVGVTEAQRILAPYLRIKTSSRPEIILKMAFDRVGNIGLKNGQQCQMSGEIATRQVHLLRAQSDAILVGIETVLNDDPLLTCRLAGLETRSPVRIVLDSQLRLPLNSQLVQSCGDYPLWVVGKADASPQRQMALAAVGVKLLLQDEGSSCIKLKPLIYQLAQMHISCLLVEGGARVAKAFFENDLVDRFVQIQTKVDLSESLDKVFLPEWKQFSQAQWIMDQKLRYGSDQWIEWVRIN